jgi:hypothetical protein
LPAIGGGPRKIDSELTENATLTSIARVSHERTTELSPSGGKPHVDQSPDSAVPEREHGVRGSQLEFAEQRNGRDTREFPHQRRNSARMLACTGDRNENGLYLPRLQILDQILDGLTVQRPVASFSSRIDTKPFFRSKQRGDWRQLMAFLCSRRHGFTSA